MPPSLGFKGSIAERFERMTIPEPNSGCLLWLGAVRPRGYGKIKLGRKLFNATHVALDLVGVAIPPGSDVLHSCDNPYCVNASHLFVGNAKVNVADMVAKGRQNFSGLDLGRGRRR